MSQHAYVGSELDLFAKAVRWKAYWRTEIRPYLRGSVLEVGAGNGNNTRWLADSPVERWVCIEPDPQLCDRLRATPFPRAPAVLAGTLEDLPETERFDSILYLDVLEHIAEDRSELQRAASHLTPGGHLIVLSPAHQWLYSPFDRAIGHQRRYSERSLRACGPEPLSLVTIRYLDAAGLIASLGNRLFLNQSMPTESQLRFWDSWLVPVSCRLDRLLGHRVGKSILAVWRRVPPSGPGPAGLPATGHD